MKKFENSLNQSQKVRKAVIPAAGFGTRLFPATKAIKKEFFPVVDRDGRAKPVILSIVEEVVNAGIEEVAVVVQAGDRAIFENFFKRPLAPEFVNKLSPQDRDYCDYLEAIGKKITLVDQEVQEGFGHAVCCAKTWVNGEPFLVSLGDHVYSSDTENSCTSQLLGLYPQVNQSAIGLTVMPAEIIHKAGCVTGSWKQPNSILSLTQLVEKPNLEYARQHLPVEGMAEDLFLCIFGLYVLTPRIFYYLEEQIKHNIRDRGEFQLTSALEQLRQEEGMTGYMVKGRCFDTGMPQAYRQTLIDFPCT